MLTFPPDYNMLREAHIHAKEQLRQERFAAMVAIEKRRLLDAESRRRWWHRFIPFTITITRRSK